MRCQLDGQVAAGHSPCGWTDGVVDNVSSAETPNRDVYHRLPPGALAKDLVEQPDRAAEQRNQAQSQRRGNLPQPCGIPTPGTTVVIEAHDEWQVTRRYLSDISMAELRKVIAAKQAADNPSPNKAKSPSIQPDSLITTRSRPGALDRRRVALKF